MNENKTRHIKGGSSWERYYKIDQRSDWLIIEKDKICEDRTYYRGRVVR